MNKKSEVKKIKDIPKMKILKCEDGFFKGAVFIYKNKEYTITQEQCDSVAHIRKSFHNPGKIAGSNGKNWEVNGKPVRNGDFPFSEEDLNILRKEYRTLTSEVFEISEKGEKLKDTSVGKKYQNVDNENPLYHLRYSILSGEDEVELKDGWVHNLTVDELDLIKNELQYQKEEEELANADFWYWYEKTTTLKVVVGELLEKVEDEIPDGKGIKKEVFDDFVQELLKNTALVKEVVKDMEDFDMLLDKEDFEEIRKVNSDIHYDVRVDEYTGKEYCVLKM